MNQQADLDYTPPEREPFKLPPSFEDRLKSGSPSVPVQSVLSPELMEQVQCLLKVKDLVRSFEDMEGFPETLNVNLVLVIYDIFHALGFPDIYCFFLVGERGFAFLKAQGIIIDHDPQSN